MKNISRSLKRIAASLGIVGLLAVVQAVPAFASGNSSNATFTLTGTPASAANTTFDAFTGSTTLTNLALPLTSNLNIGTVTDNDGAGHGWTLVLNLSQFVNANQTLAISSLTTTTASAVTPLAPAVATGVTFIAVAIPLDTGADVTLAAATTGNGMGTFSFGVVPVALTVPPLAHAGAYLATGTTTFTPAV